MMAKLSASAGALGVLACLGTAGPASQACLSVQLAAQVRRDWNCMLATGTLSADDFSIRVSAAADGPDAVPSLLSFAESLSARTHG